MDKPCQKRHQQLTTAGCIIGSTVLVRRHAFILCAHVQDAVAVDLEGHLDGKNQGFDFWQDWQPTNNGLVCWGKSSTEISMDFPMKIMGFSGFNFPVKRRENQSIETNINNMNSVGSYHLYRHLIPSWPRNCGAKTGGSTTVGVVRNAYLYSKMEDRKCAKRICQMISTKLGFNKRKMSGSPTKKGVWPLIVPDDIWRMWQSLSSMQTLQNWTHAFVCTSLCLSKHTFIVSFCLKIL